MSTESTASDTTLTARIADTFCLKIPGVSPGFFVVKGNYHKNAVELCLYFIIVFLRFLKVMPMRESYFLSKSHGEASESLVQCAAFHALALCLTKLEKSRGGEPVTSSTVRVMGAVYPALTAPYKMPIY